MKLFSLGLERAVIKGICSKNERIASILLSHLDDSYFHYEPCKAAFKRVLTVFKKRSVVLRYDELLEDPALNEEFRDLLREGEVPECKTEVKAKRLIQSLEKYRKARMMYALSKDVIERLKGSEVDVEALLDTLTNELTRIRSHEQSEDIVHTLGKEANALELVDSALSVEDEILLKTGFKDVDEKNGGIPSEGVMLLAATTSGGKSTMLMNLLMNIYKLNKADVVNVSLEMNENKLTRRMLSRMTGIPYWKFVRKKLSVEERKEAKVAWRRFHKYGAKNECRFSMFCPTRSVSMTSLLMLLKPFGFKVIGIDYISLLEGVDEKDQWKVLSALTREAKIFSAENKCLVILLAQLDADDDRIRYSKGILEHADAAWTWNYYKPEVREAKTIPIRQLKARDQDLFPFDLKEDFPVMAIRNMDEESSNASSHDPDSEKSDSKPKADDLDLNTEPEMAYDAGQA